MLSIKAVYKMYHDGFSSMVLGRTLWKLIVIKLFVLFALIWPLLHTGPKTSAEKEALTYTKLIGK